LAGEYEDDIIHIEEYQNAVIGQAIGFVWHGLEPDFYEGSRQITLP